MPNIGQQFVEQTKYPFLSPSGQRLGVPAPPLSWEPPGCGRTIPLGLPLRPETPFPALLDSRRSLRDYAPHPPFSLEELSFLLWSCQGVQKLIPGKATLRTVPSAGARHPLETFVLLNQVEGLDPGFYWFDALRHHLREVNLSPKAADEAVEACLDQKFVKTAGAVFFWVAVAERSTWRYSERAYRYLFLDAGHACQNLYLAAECIHAGACAVAAFDDEKLNRLLHLDGTSVFALYAATAGRKRE